MQAATPPSTPSSPTPRLDELRKGASFYDRGTSFHRSISALDLLVRASAGGFGYRRDSHSLVSVGDPVVEELTGEGVVIELLKSGKCVVVVLPLSTLSHAPSIDRLQYRCRLKAGTIDGIIDWFLDVRFDGDARVQRAFLLCYRLFIQPKELWDKVRDPAQG